MTISLIQLYYISIRCRANSIMYEFFNYNIDFQQTHMADLNHLLPQNDDPFGGVRHGLYSFK